MNIGIYGLGEAGSLISADLSAEGIDVIAYDPADVPTPTGVQRVNSPEEVVCNSHLLLAITAGQDAIFAMQQAVNTIPQQFVYADLSTNDVKTKKTLAQMAANKGFYFVDVAMMGTVPGKGLRVPMLASGSGTNRLIELCIDLPAQITVISEHAGDAATRKLLRSIMMKGLAANVIEAMRAAEQAGCAEWLWNNMAEEINRADAAMLSRFVSGTLTHAERRLHEMEASQALLNELGVEPLMTAATVEFLRRIPDQGVPHIPEETKNNLK